MTRADASAWMLGALLTLLPACYSPLDSQAYFVRAAEGDKALEPLYGTAIYTVYFDYALGRCVVHSSHTWGQQGGGGGGTGIGISTFPCNPFKVRERAHRLGLEVYPPRIRPPRMPAATGRRPTGRQVPAMPKDAASPAAGTGEPTHPTE